MALVEAHPLTPQIVLGVTALVVLLFDSVWPQSRNNAALSGIATVGSVAAAGAAAWFLAAGTGQAATGGPLVEFGGELVVDGASLLFTVVFASVTALVAVASFDYVREERYVAEYYALVLLAATGMSLMASANSLATGFVALELASLPSYALVAYLKDNRGSVEAGLKYFLVGALSSAVLAYGISLVFAATGSLQFPAVAAALGTGTEAAGVLGVGVLMVAGGFAFKTASVPFHFWAPEAYEGAPAPISAFLSSASKAAGFVLAFRAFTTAFPLGTLTDLGVDWAALFAVIAVVTMTLGNFAAATQENVKRMLAYSSIGHAGYVFIGLAALDGGGDLVLGASMMHLVVYGFMNTGAFLFVALAEYWDVGRAVEDYNGLAREAPIACLAMTVFLLSLAGLPVGAGFLSKYVLFAGAVGAGYAWLALIAAVNSGLSLYYYARVVRAMWIEEADGDFGIDHRPLGIYAALVVAAAATVGLLVAFDPLATSAVDAAAALLQ